MNAIECAFEGRVGQAPTLRQTTSGKPWCSLSIAVGADDDEGGTQWVAISVFGSLSESAAAVEKGTRVYIEGRLRLNTWVDRDGKERTGLQCAATLIQPIGQIGRRKRALFPSRKDVSTRRTHPDPHRDWQRPLEKGDTDILQDAAPF